MRQCQCAVPESEVKKEKTQRGVLSIEAPIEVTETDKTMTKEENIVKTEMVEEEIGLERFQRIREWP